MNLRALVWMPVLALSGAAFAASEQEVRRAFEKAQKKGAVAIYEQRCGGHGSLHFPGTPAESAARVSAALMAMRALDKEGQPGDGCPAGLEPGSSRILELYPDGTVRELGPK